MFFAYLSLTFALVITPGATTAVVVRNTLAGGPRGGFRAATGAAIGNTTHAAAAGLGLAVILSRVPSALIALQLAGGLYLAWLGTRSALRVIRRDAVPITGALLAASGSALQPHALREGVLVNLVSPPIITFYLAVVPTFVPAGVSPWYYALLAGTHVGMAFIVHNGWVFALDRLRHVLERPVARLVLEGLTAAALLVFAVRVLSGLVG